MTLFYWFLVFVVLIFLVLYMVPKCRVKTFSVFALVILAESMLLCMALSFRNAQEKELSVLRNNAVKYGAGYYASDGINIWYRWKGRNNEID
jgi:hypothetical protein